jgi:drug/metabolite transporter (DMT)-like permease
LNGAAVATVLGYGSAGFAAVLAWLIFKESLGLTKIIAVVLSLFGCVLVAEAYDLNLWMSNPLGIVVGLFSGLVFAGYSLAGKEAANRNLNAWTALLYSFVFGSVFIFLFNLFPALPGAAGTLSALVPRLPLDGWLLLLALSFIASTLGFGLYTLSMNYLPASVANLLATTEPVMTAIEAYLFLGERMTEVQVVGSGIILLAVALLQVFGERNR